MSINLTGSLLEGIRVSTGNNSFTFPPTVNVDNDTVFQASYTERAEYCIIADSISNTATELEIADSDLIFRWTRNESSVIRFDYDGFGRKWLPTPGSSPNDLGAISNEPRLLVSSPDLGVTDAPFDLYIGVPNRSITFTVQLVGNESGFTDPGVLASGTVQVSQDKGELNFSQADVTSFTGQSVINQQQSFFGRTRTTGRIGDLPESSIIPPDLFLNPRPATGQHPRVRINYQNYLTPIEVANESGFTTPSSGTFQWALDTGKINLSDSDINTFSSQGVYYDGVFIDSFQLTRTSLGSIVAFPSSSFTVSAFIGLTNTTNFLIFAEKTGEPRRYYRIVLVTSASKPASGTARVDTTNGNVYFNAQDASKYGDYDFFYIDTFALLEKGVNIQFFRSGANSTSVSQVGDFSIRYAVEEQLIVDGIPLSDLVLLPTVPLVTPNLLYTVEKGTLGGTFVGDLTNNVDPEEFGVGFILNLDNKQLQFTNRKTINFDLEADSSIIKIEDPAISIINFEASIDGVSSIPGTDFDFEPNSGLIEFTDPVGENNPDNVLDIAGQVILPDRFLANEASFPASESVGNFIFISSGDNAGIYEIQTFVSTTEVLVSPNFSVAQVETADFRKGVDVIADRFFADIVPPLKKFTLEKSPSASGIFVVVDSSDISLLAPISQVNLNTAALPGEVFRATYVHLDSDDEGVTTNPTTITEFAQFPIRQESGVITSGSAIVSFNPENRLLSSSSLSVFVNGVTQDPNQFILLSNQTIELGAPLTTETVTINYFVSEAIGGERSFTLLNTPIDVDTPDFLQGETSIVLNGDQTNILSVGSPLTLDSDEVFLVDSASYDGSEDTTSVELNVAPTKDFINPSIQASNSVTDSEFFVSESSSIDVIPQGARFFKIAGDVSFPSGTVLTFDGDPYLAIDTVFNSDENKTTVTISAASRKSYISPFLVRTIRPVFQIGSNFQTSAFTKLDPAPTVIRMGTNQKVLVVNSDYSISEGGAISLNDSIGFGESLFALYVSRTTQPAGTNIELNYAHAISPVQLEGQKLRSTYDLLSPDSFFYRVETVSSFIPEVQDFLRASSQSGSAGPNIDDVKSLQTKDQGSTGLFSDEKSLGNFDIVFSELLGLYNTIINAYEDILSNTDGRVVGGLQGKFRYDGNKNNPSRNTFEEITNDVDDSIVEYTKIKLISFIPLNFQETEVLKFMWQDNQLSRIFPTQTTVTTGLNDKVSLLDFGSTMGSLGVENISSIVGTMENSSSRLIFTKVLNGDTFVVETPNGESINGDEENGIPPFAVGKEVEIRELDGTLDKTGNITSINVVSGVTRISLDESTTLKRGTLFRSTSDSDDSDNHFYTVGRDLNVNFDNGQVTNMTFGGLLANLQTEVFGEELMDTTLTFRRSETEPFRIPVLDGSIFGDDGRYPEPLLGRDNELRMLGTEINLIDSNIVLAIVAIDTVTVLFSGAFSVKIGDSVTWSDGPNSGSTRTVINTGPGFLIVGSSLIVDNTGDNTIVVSVSANGTISQVLSEEQLVISTNSESGPPIGALIGNIDSQLKAFNRIPECFGETAIDSTTGTIVSTGPGILSDTSFDFVLAGAQEGSLIHVSTGSNQGLYRVLTATTSLITLDTTEPFTDFRSTGGVSYKLILPFSFLGEEQFGILSDFSQKTVVFNEETQVWENDLTFGNKSERRVSVSTRIQDLEAFVSNLDSILADGDLLYETRYTWIKQRTDKKQGTLRRQFQAALDRLENIQNLIEDQRKLLISEGLDL